MKQITTHISYLIIIVVLIVILFKCNTKSDIKPDIIIETQIEHVRDTIIIPTYIHIKSDQSIVKVDENNVYKDSTLKYYHQTFTDSNYSLNTYGGYVDSIDLTFKCEDKIIYDSTIINTTKTITNTVFKPFKHTLGVEYMYNINNNVIVDYTRNFGRFGLSIGLGMNINNKVPLMKAGLKYSF